MNPVEFTKLKAKVAFLKNSLDVMMLAFQSFPGFEEYVVRIHNDVKNRAHRDA